MLGVWALYVAGMETVARYGCPGNCQHKRIKRSSKGKVTSDKTKKPVLVSGSYLAFPLLSMPSFLTLMVGLVALWVVSLCLNNQTIYFFQLNCPYP